MPIGIRTRFFSVFIATTLVTVSGMLVLISYSLLQNYRQHVLEQNNAALQQVSNALAGVYRTEQSWQPLRQSPALWRLLEQSAPMQQLLLMDSENRLIAGEAELAAMHSTPVQLDGETIGYLATSRLTGDLHAADKAFIHQQTLYNTLIAAVMLLLPLLAFIPITSRMAGPIHRLLAATRNLTAGRFDSRLPETSHDELGQLARDFNLLAKTLENNEKARNQWIADISHELRTPIAVLRAQLEALLDGVRQPDNQQLRMLHNKTGEMERLIDNLYQLSLSDLGAITYRKEVLPIRDVVEEAIQAFEPSFRQSGISLKVSLNLTDKALVYADEKRLMQLFNNLFNNTLRYTDSGGELIINAYNDSKQVTITLDDSTPGLESADLEKLFERLYRVEPSRNRSLGGSGLGLSICKNIIDAHNGSIHAGHSALGGLSITVILPLEKRRTLSGKNHDPRSDN